MSGLPGDEDAGGRSTPPQLHRHSVSPCPCGTMSASCSLVFALPVSAASYRSAVDLSPLLDLRRFVEQRAKTLRRRVVHREDALGERVDTGDRDRRRRRRPRGFDRRIDHLHAIAQTSSIDREPSPPHAHPPSSSDRGSA